jgi:plastocyanin
MAILGLLSAAYVPAASSAETQSITIQGFAFNPGTITVAVGTIVAWQNEDSTDHTVTSDTGAFESGSLSKGQTFQFTFNTAGTFNYHCRFHSSMTGSIVVTGAQQPGQQPEEVQEFSLIHSLKDLKIYPQTLTVKKGVKVRLFNTATDGSHPTVAISSDDQGKNPVFGVKPFDVEVGQLTIVEFTPDQTGDFFITHQLHGHNITSKLTVKDQ